MARIDQADVSAIKEKADIVEIIGSYLPLVQKGRAYTALCPFHDDHDPSMRIDPGRKIYKCFVCGEGGDVFKFVSKMDGLDFPGAVQKVAGMIGYPLKVTHTEPKADPNANLHALLDNYRDYCAYELRSQDGKAALSYLQSRKFDDRLISKFQIGYAPKADMSRQYLQAKGFDTDELAKAGIVTGEPGSLQPFFYERIMIPVHDANGKMAGFTARIMPDKEGPKYINTSQTVLYEKGNLIFNYHRAKNAARKAGGAVLVEGAMDVLGLEKAGIQNGLACLGTAFTDTQLSLLARLQVPITVFYDADNAGQAAVWKFGQAALQRNIPFQVVNTKNAKGKDPDEIYCTSGKQAVLDTLQNTVSFVEFAFDYLQKRYDLNNYEDKKTYANTIRDLIQRTMAPYEQQTMFDRLKDLTGFTFQVSSPSYDTGYDQGYAPDPYGYPSNYANQTSSRKFEKKGKWKTRNEPEIPVYKGIPPVDCNGRREAELNMMYAILYDQRFAHRYERGKVFFSQPDCNDLYSYIANAYHSDQEVDPVALLDVIEEPEARALLLELTRQHTDTEKIDRTYDESAVKITETMYNGQLETCSREFSSAPSKEDKLAALLKKRDATKGKLDLRNQETEEKGK
jgi:DNA primase